MSAFKFFTRMHGNGKPSKSWVLISLHWPWSLTWRFVVIYTPGNNAKYCRQGLYFMRTYKYERGINFQAGLNLWWLGQLSIQTQPNMRRK